MTEFLATAAAATDGLKGMPWEKLGIVGVLYAVIKLLIDALKAKLPSRFAAPAASCKMSEGDSTHIADIRHALIDRDGVIPRDHEAAREEQRATTDVLKEMLAEMKSERAARDANRPTR